MNSPTILKVVGYWAECAGVGRYPSPRRLIGHIRNRDDIVEYLVSGNLESVELGYSFCRFACGIPDEQMGSKNLTDGVFLWPEGLAHYIREHGVLLPHWFVDHIEGNRYAVPDIETENVEYRFDSTDWVKWAHEQGC